MGLWIEILYRGTCSSGNMSASAMGLWIEIFPASCVTYADMSASAMGLWIEIFNQHNKLSVVNVSLCDGAVD